MPTMETEVCPDCGEATILALAEPDARPLRFNARPIRGWRLLQVTESHGAAVPTEVHEIHSATCKAVNRS